MMNVHAYDVEKRGPFQVLAFNRPVVTEELLSVCTIPDAPMLNHPELRVERLLSLR